MAAVPPPFPGRNDIPSAIAYARWLQTTGRWEPSVAEALVGLQDNPQAYLEALWTGAPSLGDAMHGMPTGRDIGDQAPDEALHEVRPVLVGGDATPQDGEA